MLISVVIPVYNVSAYIEKCLSSVCAQTMTDGVECIIVDDCCTDNSMELTEKIIAEYGGEIKFIKLYHTKNRGASTARNTGIKEAKGDYIYFMDSDDVITPDCLETLWALIDKYPGVDIVRGNVICINRGDMSIDKYSWIPEYSQDKNWLRKYLQKGHIPQNIWNQLIKREFIIANNLYFKEGLILEEWHWYHFVGRYINSMAFTKEVTYTYNENPTGVIATYYVDNYDVDSICTTVNELIERIDPSAIHMEMQYILFRSYGVGKANSIMGGNFFRDTFLYKEPYFRKLYDNYRYINEYGRKSFKGLITYFMFEMYLYYTCRQIAKHQAITSNNI